MLRKTLQTESKLSKYDVCISSHGQQDQTNNTLVRHDKKAEREREREREHYHVSHAKRNRYYSVFWTKWFFHVGSEDMYVRDQKTKFLRPFFAKRYSTVSALQGSCMFMFFRKIHVRRI